jgi:hypothetical protein
MWGRAMAEFIGRSGADGIAKAIDRVCKIDQKYHAKMTTAISLSLAAGLISSGDAALVTAFLNAIKLYCDAFNAVAANSGFPIP